MTPRYFAFGPFRLDVVDERLWRHAEHVPLGHKAFAVLGRLLSNPNQLVTKDDLLAGAWPDTSVSEAVLTTAMREIRAALGDTARTPQFVQTVYGRGYRFIASVTEGHGGGAARTGIVGRDTELARLDTWYAEIQLGHRRVGFIAGEAGIGKTTIVDAFVTAISAGDSVRVCRGQCIEQYGAGEAYLPVLEALGRLARDPDSHAARTLRTLAPSWLVHLPSLAGGTERSSPVPPARMLRELSEALEALASHEPLVLVLEDLHWSDDATLEWLEYVARRRAPARLLVLATYRPVESLLQRRRLRDILVELRHQPQCGEIVLDYLSAGAVQAYVRQHCGDLPGLDRVTQGLHRRTGGLPLFLAGIVEQIIQKRSDDRWPESGIDLTADPIPMNVRQFIERRFEELSEEDLGIVEAAAVAGEAFSVAAVAAVSGWSHDRIESRCEALNRTHRLFTPRGVIVWPDGTIAAGYAFRHSLFQETALTRISPERRVRIHLAIGTRLESAYGAKASPVAAELAMHFEHARTPGKALVHLAQAARNAMDRSAYREAHRHIASAVSMLNAVTDHAERTDREATVSLLLGQLFDAIRGWGTEEAARAYEQARDLCATLHDEPRWFQATWGLIASCVVRAELRRTQELSRSLLVRAKQRRNRLFRMAAHVELGGAALALGRGAAGRRHFLLAGALEEPGGGPQIAPFGMDIGIFARTWSTHLFWQEGYPDRARALAGQTIADADRVKHPFTQTVTLAYAAMLAQFRRDVEEVGRLAESAIEHASEHGFPYYLVWSEILRGWSRGIGGARDDTIDEMRRAIAAMRTNAGLRLPYYRGLLAEACGRAGRSREGLQEIAIALTEVRRTGECWWEPELLRIRGTLLSGAGRAAEADAESSFRCAIGLARRYGARVLELRAIVSLARLQHDDERKLGATRRLLSSAFAGFTEGFDTPDLADARALLRHDAPSARGGSGRRTKAI
jgi:DNA-binding winged helix-turn-helix (wHTH) protein/predicted ATPase